MNHYFQYNKMLCKDAQFSIPTMYNQISTFFVNFGIFLNLRLISNENKILRIIYDNSLYFNRCIFARSK